MLTEDKFKKGYKEVKIALKSLQKARELFADKGGMYGDLYHIHKIIEDVIGYKLNAEKFFVDFFLKNTNN